MRQPRQVPQLGQQRQQFARDTLGPIAHPMMMGQPPPQQQPAVDTISERVQELALEIYARIAVEHLRGDVDPEYLDVLAGRSQTAARVYFEQLGIQFNGVTNGQS